MPEEVAVRLAFNFSKWIPCVALLLAAGCSDSTEPRTPQQATELNRTWQFVVQHHDDDVEALGDEQELDVGILSDRQEFGQLLTVPSGHDASGKAEVFSNETGETYWVQAQAPSSSAANDKLEGAGVGLDQEYTYVIDSENPFLQFTLTKITLETIDSDPFLPTRLDCQRDPDVDLDDDCSAPIGAGIFFALYADTPNKGVELSIGANAFLTGHINRFLPEVEVVDVDEAAFALSDFQFTPDVSGAGVGDFAKLELKSPIPIVIPMTIEATGDSLRIGDTLRVLARVTAFAQDLRQLETFAGAYFRDPVSPVGVQIEARGVHLVPAPRTSTPAQELAPPCSAPTGAAGSLQFSASNFVTGERGMFEAGVTITRTGGASGLVSVTLTTSDGTASSGSDYSALTKVVRFGDGQSGSRTVHVRLHGDHDIEPDETVNLTLSDPRGCATLGAQKIATLTIRDDDDQGPPADFSIGGTVSGLAGSGLVLHERNSGSESRPTGNGPFTIVPARAGGFAYDVVVATQPTNPLQSCSVANGTGTLSNANVVNIAVTCTTPATTGSLDATFGTAGRVTSTMTGGATAMALQPNGKVLIVGNSKVQRFNANGTIDQSFGTSGQADFAFTGVVSNSPQGVAVQPDGRIVVVGFVSTNSRDDCAVARYNPDGTLDRTFGTGGRVIVDFASASARGWAVALQPGGEIVVAGQAAFPRGVSFDNDFALARLSAAGAVEPAFGSGGTTHTNIGGDADWAYGVRIQSDGKIVLAGHAAVDGGSDPDVGLARYNANGTLDTSFGHNDGIVKTDLGMGNVWNEAFDLVIQPDGKIVIAGQGHVGGNFQFLLARFTAGGSSDVTFGSSGVSSTPFTTQGDVARGLALQSDGKIIVAGRAAFLGSSDFGLARYTTSGALDPSFGTGGTVSIDFTGGSDGAEAVAVQSDGKIVAAGFARNGTSTGAGIVRVVP